MRNWKVIAGVAGAGAVLSLLLGIAAANPFGVILLRMLLCGLGAGGVAYGLSLVLERFLPELGREPAGEATPEAGGRLNIVIPAENPHVSQGMDLSPELEAPTEDAVPADLTSEYPEDETLSEQGGLLGGAVEIADEGGGPGQVSEAGALAEDVEDLGYPEEVPAEPASPSAEAASAVEVDTLDAGLGAAEPLAEAATEPDLDEETPSPRVEKRRRGARPDGGADAMDMAREDPENVARAVRTMLKRDQEG